MAYLLQKHKNIILLTLVLTIMFCAWYIYTNKNINAIPEKADLVLTSFNTVRTI